MTGPRSIFTRLDILVLVLKGRVLGQGIFARSTRASLCTGVLGRSMSGSLTSSGSSASDHLGLVPASLASFGRWLVLRLIGQVLPFGQVVGALFFDVGLSINSLRTYELLCDGILDLDRFDKLVEVRLLVSPFLRGNNLDDTRFHAVLVDLVIEPLEVGKLSHCLVVCQKHSFIVPILRQTGLKTGTLPSPQ